MTEITKASTIRAKAQIAPALPMLRQQTKTEFLKLWRLPAFSIFSLTLPAILYLFFGLSKVSTGQHDVPASKFLVASLASYGIMAVMIFSFGVNVATERGQRMNVLIRAAPLKPAVFLLAKLITAICFALLMLILLFITAVIVGGVRMPDTSWLDLAGRLLAGSIPFIAIGFAIGYWAGPNSAVAVANLVYLLLSFASGLFLPLSLMPGLVQHLAPLLPSYRLGQLAWGAIGVHEGSLDPAVLWLAGYAILFVIIALRGYRREEGKTFG